VEKWDAFRLSGNHQPSHLLYQLGQLGDVGGDAPRFLLRISGQVALSLLHGRTPLPPHLLATRFPQKEILQDELAIAGGKRSAANSARYITVNGLWSGFGFDDLIKRVAMGALEMDCRGSDHDMSLARTYPMLSIFQRQRQLIQ
jgi:hypothetical protein